MVFPTQGGDDPGACRSDRRIAHALKSFALATSQALGRTSRSGPDGAFGAPPPSQPGSYERILIELTRGC